MVINALLSNYSSSENTGIRYEITHFRHHETNVGNGLFSMCQHRVPPLGYSASLAVTIALSFS